MFLFVFLWDRRFLLFFSKFLATLSAAAPDPLHRYDLSSCCHLTSSSEGRHIAATLFPFYASPVLVGLFAKFRGAIISYVMSARLSASWNISVSIVRISFKIYDLFLLKAAEKIQVWLKYEKKK
jgi:hypothetical protein